MVCRNCGRKYTQSGTYDGFCCEGCRIEFKNKLDQQKSNKQDVGKRSTKFSSIIIILLIIFCVYKCTEKKDNATTPAKTSTNIESVKSE